MKLKANAKINLTLDIVGKKQNGYHLLDSVFQSVSLHDNIEIEKADCLTVDFSNCEVKGEESIAYLAAKAFFGYTEIKDGAKITIESHIPLGSGMGGGSSDAAGVLVGLNSLFGAGLSTKQLIEIGSTIGADVPFCIVGGTARVGGIGENVSPITFIGNLPVVIIKDGKKLSTGEMYSQLDKNPSNIAFTENACLSIENKDKQGLLDNISNAFNSVCNTEKEKKLLLDNGALGVGLSGSGPSVFGIFENEEKAMAVALKLKGEDHNAFFAEFKDKGIEIL